MARCVAFATAQEAEAVIEKYGWHEKAVLCPKCLMYHCDPLGEEEVKKGEVIQ